jgi:hypothetical protein
MYTITTNRPNLRLITALLLCAVILSSVFIPAEGVSADPGSPLDVSGSVTFTAAGSPVVIAPGLTMTGTTNIDFVQISISDNFSAGGDYLGMAGTSTSGTVSGIAYSYDNTTGIMLLQNNKTTAVYQSVLRQVTYYNIAANPSTAIRTINLSVGDGSYCASTGHYYEYVASGTIRWDTANTAANGLNHFGLQGYLATVTSPAENNFIQTKIGGWAWMGATDAAGESYWKWVTGPEAGTDFFRQTGADASSGDLAGVYSGSVGGGGVAVGGRYNNWAVDQPDDWGLDGEDYAHFYADGTWNDMPIDHAAVVGYVVEYGGMPGDPTPQLNGSVTVNVVKPDISIRGNGNIIANGSVAVSLLDGTDFGSVDIAAGTVTRTFTVKNNGGADLTLGGTPQIALTGPNAADFSVTANATTPVAVSGNSTFQVTFNPGVRGLRTAGVSISSNDADTTPYTFTIRGTGTKALTVTGITAADKLYDGTAAATLNTAGAVLAGVVPGDDVTLNIAGAAGAFSDAGPGNGKTVTISALTLNGADAGFYTIALTTTTANIILPYIPPAPAPTTPPVSLTPTPTPTPTATIEPSPTPSATSMMLQVDLGGQTDFAAITAEGEVQGNAMVTSTDQRLTLTIPEGTRVLVGDAPTLHITITPDENAPEPPAEQNIIGIPYQCLPDGTTFDPAITITWNYDPAGLPPGTDETKLQVAFYNKVTGKWEAVEGIVDTVNHTIKAKVSHFSIYAVIAPAAVPSLTPTSTPPPTQPVLPPTTPPKTETSDNQGWIIAIVVVIVLFLFLTVLLVRRKKYKPGA